MIHAIVGLMNSGKTLYMTYLGFLAFVNGKDIISSYDLTFTHRKINRDFLIWLAHKSDKEDFVLDDTCFLLDELWIWLDARRNQANTVATYFFLQSSKSDSEIHITAQDNSQNDLRLRRNLHKISVCSRVLYLNGEFKSISEEKRFLPEKYLDRLYIKVVELKKVNVGFMPQLIPVKTIHIKAKPIFKLFDTRQRIYAK